MVNNKSILAYLALGVGVLALSFSVMFVRWANAPIPVTALLAIPLLGEIPSVWQGLGGIIALLGIYIVNRSHQQDILKTPNL